MADDTQPAFNRNVLNCLYNFVKTKDTQNKPVIHFSTVINQFGENGDKTGWTYITIPAAIAQQIKPGNKKTFRVKGKLDDYAIKGVALLPAGEGDFMMALNATIRKAIRKGKGATLQVALTEDEEEIKPPADFIDCLADEPAAGQHFKRLAKSHQNYFTKWITDAKTPQTRDRRIAASVNALAKGWGYGEMIRSLKQDREDISS